MLPESELNKHVFIDSLFDPILIFLIITCGILINLKFLRNMRDDDKDRGAGSNGLLLRDVMAANAKTQIWTWPMLWMLFSMINGGVDFPSWAQPAFCYIKLVSYTCRIYIAFNSLAVAAMRYTFVVQNNSVNSYGITKAKNMFYYGSLFIPLFLSILAECTIDVSTEFGDKAFSICQNSHCIDNINGNHTDHVFENLRSPIFQWFHQHVSENISRYIAIFTRVSLWIIFGNFAEGIIYWKTFSWIAR